MSGNATYQELRMPTPEVDTRFRLQANVRRISQVRGVLV